MYYSINQINWDAVFRCAQQYLHDNPNHNDAYYQKYLMDTWGIDHNMDYIRVIDEQKYMMFLLKWA